MSLPEKLQQLDQTLIRLLGERIALLAESDVPTMQDQFRCCVPLLTQAGVPEFVWKNIITDCMAATASQPVPLSNATSRNVTIVGGRGMMGRFFAERLSMAGHTVQVLEYDEWDQAESRLANADLVLVCVPLKSTVAVIRKVAQYLAPHTALADIASVKTPMVQAMLESHAGPVMGLHPMFGPGVQSFLAQKVVFCPGRESEAFQWFLDLIAAEGGKLVTCTPEEHDQMMVAVQAIRHFSTFSLGVFLAEEGIDVERSLDFASPIYRVEINLISRLFAQNASLYIDIMLASEERCQAIQRLVETCSRLSRLLVQGDRTALISGFAAAHKVFQKEAERALKESNHAISSLSTFLAASEVEAERTSCYSYSNGSHAIDSNLSDLSSTEHSTTVTSSMFNCS